MCAPRARGAGAHGVGRLWDGRGIALGDCATQRACLLLLRWRLFCRLEGSERLRGLPAPLREREGGRAPQRGRSKRVTPGRHQRRVVGAVGRNAGSGSWEVGAWW